MTRRVHVIGAGLAGLSAAIRLVDAGVSVTVWEAAPVAGGRCRSFVDATLETTIDNGAHVMLSGNADIRAYVDRIGAGDEVVCAPRARFEFLDVRTDQTWAVDMGAGRGLFSVLCGLVKARHRPLGTRGFGGAFVLLRDLYALKGGRGKTVAACLDVSSTRFETFWQPLCVAILNTNPDQAAAELLWAVLEATVLQGGCFARPLFTCHGLGAALVDPALATLRAAGADVRLGTRVRSLKLHKGRVAALTFAKGSEVLRQEDAVVVAVPHFAVSDLVDGLTVPQNSCAIVNVHYRLDRVLETRMRGLIGSPVQWVFTRGSLASTTVSAAEPWLDMDAHDIARTLWPDVAKALDIDASHHIPKYRVIKERRATFAQTPDALNLRPGTGTGTENLFLAGDWTDTGLPATLEGAVKSGRLAAQAVLNAVRVEV